MTPDIVQKNDIAASWWASRTEEKRNGKSESGCAGVCVKSCCAVQLSEMKHLRKFHISEKYDLRNYGKDRGDPSFEKIM